LQTTTTLPNDSSRQNIPLVTDISFGAKIYSVRADYSQNIFHDFKMESGLQTIYTTRNNKAGYFDQLESILQPVASLSNSFRYREHIDALYFSIKKDWKRLSAQAGLRMEHTVSDATSYEVIDKPDSSFSLQYSNLFPTLYITYTADSSSKDLFNLSAGKRITRPNYQDLNPSSFFFDRNTSFTGNPLLHPELSTNLELSYTYARVWASGITFSHSKGTIIQAYEQVGSAYIMSTRNIDAVNSISIHSNLSVSIGKIWNVNLSAEYSTNHYKGLLFNVPVDIKGDVFRASSYNQFTLGKGWSADMTTQYRSKAIFAQAVLKPTWQMHASVQKRISERSVISFGGRDLFRTSIFQRTVTIPGVIAFSANRSDSRYLTISCSYKFGPKGGSRVHKTGIENEQSRVGG
jgi:outer membrane receptor protein involved in Fe transport